METILSWLRAAQDSTEPIGVDVALKVSWAKVYDREIGESVPRRSIEINISTNRCGDREANGWHSWEFKEYKVSKKELMEIKTTLKKLLPKSITDSSNGDSSNIEK